MRACVEVPKKASANRLSAQLAIFFQRRLLNFLKWLL